MHFVLALPALFPILWRQEVRRMTRKELTDKGGRKLFTNTTKSDEDVALEHMFIGVAPAEEAE